MAETNMRPPATNEPIDAVVAWVDGDDPAHRARREQYLPRLVAANALEPVAAAKRRFSDNDEIRYCLRSLRNYAPWLRTIWLVTDAQTPPSLDRSLASQSGIEIVDHRDIFRDLEQLLPTFNSLSIETLLWRIPGLAQHFIYLNDDMFLTAPAEPKDFFVRGRPVLRGKMMPFSWESPSPFHDQNRRRGAELLGWTGDHYFAAAHVAHPMRLEILEELWADHRPAFEANAAHRFRSRAQFWSVSAHDHRALETDRARIYDKPRKDWQQFTVAFCDTGEAAKIRARLEKLARHKVRLSCINFFEGVVRKVPDALRYLDAATGPAQPFEIAGADRGN